MEFRLLGSLEVVDSDREVPLGGGRRRELLTYLLIHANEVVSAERLIDELWGENPPATAAKSVQVYVSQLRKVLHSANGRPDAEVLLTRGNGYVLRVDPDDFDVRRFERALTEAQRSMSAGEPRRAAEQLDDALALWRGPPLGDFAYEAFAQQEIARLEELRLVALETRIAAGLALGQHDRLVGELQALVRDHPLREQLRAQLMLALYRSGRQADALAAYREGRDLLQEELGLEPTPALRELERQILVQSPTLAAPTVEPRRPDSVPPLPAADVPDASPARPTGARRMSRPRAGALIAMSALLLGGAAIATVVERGGREGAGGGLALDVAANSVVAIDADGQRAELAVPLPGRPADVAAARGTVWAATIDSASVTAVDAQARAIVRSVPLEGTPDAIAVGEGSVWVADGARGTLSRIEPGYEAVSERIRYPRARGRLQSGSGGLRLPRSSLAVGGGAVWITNGSSRLIRVDPRSGRMRSIRMPRPVNAVTAGAGAVWVLAAEAASVFRLDTGRNAVSETIPIVGRGGATAPSPAAIAAAGSVWVLNANTATVTRIDPRTRGVVDTIELGVDRVPSDITAAGDVAWVANGDGTLARIGSGDGGAAHVSVGESLERATTDGERVWVTVAAIDHRLPGGTR